MRCTCSGFNKKLIIFDDFDWIVTFVGMCDCNINYYVGGQIRTCVPVLFGDKNMKQNLKHALVSESG